MKKFLIVPVFGTWPVSVIRKGDWKLHLYREEANAGKRVKKRKKKKGFLQRIKVIPGC